MDADKKMGLTSHLSTRCNLLPQETGPTRGDSAGSRSLQGGLRKQGYIKRSAEGKPLVTIITVVFNGASTLEETIRSVLYQTYDNVEYIIIDGGSGDGTVDIIRAYDDVIDYWISGQDNGIYDAMNKGISLASGMYLHFLNADDHYLHSGVLERVVDLFEHTGSQIIVGDALMLSKQSGSGYIRHSDVNKYYYLFKGMPQQAFFYDAALFKTGGFDERYAIAADLDFYLSRLIESNTRIRRVNWPVIVFNTGATSSNQALLDKERDVIIERYYSRMERILFRNRLFRSLFVKNELQAGRPGIIDRIVRKIVS